MNLVHISDEKDYPVVMSLDGIYKNGRHLGPALSMEIPNDVVMRIIQNHPEIVFGASVHPYRIVREMMDDTARCIDAGASFFHWIPSAQQIDPSDQRCIPFYLTLAREGIPLLFHRAADTADEIAGIANNRYNAPSKMKKALELGVRVVAAQVLPLDNRKILAEDRQFFQELLEMLMVADSQGWNLYADVSVFCNRSRVFYIERLRKEVQEGTISLRRLTKGWGCFIPQLLHMLEYQSGSDDVMCSLREIRHSQRNCGAMLEGYGIDSRNFTPMHHILRQGAGKIPAERQSMIEMGY